MSSWLSKKFQSQFKSQDVSKVALKKLKILENKDNAGVGVPGNSKDTSFICRNCSTVSGLNNTINVTLSQNLLTNTNFADLTTLEEVSRCAGFQEFLSSQLQLYFKFISNASSSNLFPTAVVQTSEVRSSTSAIHADERTLAPIQSQGRNSKGMVQQDFDTLSNSDEGLSVVQEEDSMSESRDFRRSDLEAQRDPSTVKGRNKAHSLVVSRPSCQTESRPIGKATADASILAGLSQIDCELDMSARRSALAKPSTTAAEKMDISSSRSQPKLPTMRTDRKLRQAATSKSDPQHSDDVFKKPLPPKQRVERLRSSNKCNDYNGARTKEDQSTQVKSRISEKDVFKAPLPVKPKATSSHRKDSEPSGTSYRSRTGRVSKPPGNFWSPKGNQSKVADNIEQNRRAAVNTSRASEKRRAEISLSEIDTESGYSSVTATNHRKIGKASRTEATNESEELETSRRLRSVTQKPAERGRRGENTEPAAALAIMGNEEGIDKQPLKRGRSNAGPSVEKIQGTKTAEEETLPTRRRGPAEVIPSDETTQNTKTAEDKPLRRRGRPKVIPSVETTQDVETSEEIQPPRRRGRPKVIPSDETTQDAETPEEENQPPGRRGPAKVIPSIEATKNSKTADELSQGRQVGVMNSCKQVTSSLQNKKSTAPAQVSRKHIFSDTSSDESDGDSFLISNKKNYYDKIRKTEANASQIGRVHNTRLHMEESSSEEEVYKVRKPGRPKKADTRPPRKNSETVVECSGDDEDDRAVHKNLIRGKSGIENSPLSNPMRRKRSVRTARYIFSGSSSDDDSLCSRKNVKQRNDQDSESFVDDASYVSFPRSSRERERPTERGGRQPKFVSRFRL